MMLSGFCKGVELTRGRYVTNGVNPSGFICSLYKVVHWRFALFMFRKSCSFPLSNHEMLDNHLVSSSFLTFLTCMICILCILCILRILYTMYIIPTKLFLSTWSTLRTRVYTWPFLFYNLIYSIKKFICLFYGSCICCMAIEVPQRFYELQEIKLLLA